MAIKYTLRRLPRPERLAPKKARLFHPTANIFSSDAASRAGRATSTGWTSALSWDSRIESYEWEVLCFVPCRYHYPPNEIQVELYRRSLLRQELSTGYDPVSGDPDFLVVGDNAFWHIYDKSIDGGQFKLIYTNNRYRLYERVRKRGKESVSSFR